MAGYLRLCKAGCAPHDGAQGCSGSRFRASSLKFRVFGLGLEGFRVKASEKKILEKLVASPR